MKVQLNASDQLAALADLDHVLQSESIAYWLFSGWAADFHADRVRRAHGDLGIAVWYDDRTQFAALLQRHGWAHSPREDEDGYTGYEHGVVGLEVAFLAAMTRAESTHRFGKDEANRVDDLADTDWSNTRAWVRRYCVKSSGFMKSSSKISPG